MSDTEKSMNQCLIKSITVSIETADGLVRTSTFVVPEYRTDKSDKMVRSHFRWFKELVSRYHNI